MKIEDPDIKKYIKLDNYLAISDAATLFNLDQKRLREWAYKEHIFSIRLWVGDRQYVYTTKSSIENYMLNAGLHLDTGRSSLLGLGGDGEELSLESLKE